MVARALRRALLPPWLRYLNKSRRARRKLEAIVHELGLPPLDANPLQGRKTSDTLFILGSGSSVLSYSPDEWAHIARHDSLGFSYWTLHPFVPSNYVFELSKLDWDFACITRNLAARLDYREKGTGVFVKDAERLDNGTVKRLLRAIPEEVGSFCLMWDAEIPGATPAEFARALTGLDRFGCFSGNGRWAVPRNRASLFLCVNLAVRAGYRDIVLCGVDLNNTNYFFKSEGFTVSPGLSVPPDYQSGSVHKTNDTAHGEMTISVILDVFDRVVLQPRGITLSVAKASSALHPRFPAFFS